MGLKILVIGLCLSVVMSSPLHNSQFNKSEDKEAETSSSGNPQDLIDAAEETSNIPAMEKKQPNDLTGQETFYPAGGVWWGVRPWGGWGGWGGYRPWYGPHWGGQRPWHGPHWGGHWGGGLWGRTSS